MARYKPYNPNQSRLVPITLNEHIYEGSLEETIHLVVEEQIDLSGLNELYKNDDTGRPAIHPKILLKVILLAYARGITGSRPIERACYENVLFMALAGGEQPDHATIAAFVTALKGHIMDIFVNVLLICEQMKLLCGTHLSLDALKLEVKRHVLKSGIYRTYRMKDDYCINCKLRTQCMGNAKARRRYLCVPQKNIPNPKSFHHPKGCRLRWIRP